MPEALSLVMMKVKLKIPPNHGFFYFNNLMKTTREDNYFLWKYLEPRLCFMIEGKALFSVWGPQIELGRWCNSPSLKYLKTFWNSVRWSFSDKTAQQNLSSCVWIPKCREVLIRGTSKFNLPPSGHTFSFYISLGTDFSVRKLHTNTHTSPLSS